jgi:hypothetical protein
LLGYLGHTEGSAGPTGKMSLNILIKFLRISSSECLGLFASQLSRDCLVIDIVGVTSDIIYTDLSDLSRTI